MQSTLHNFFVVSISDDIEENQANPETNFDAITRYINEHRALRLCGENIIQRIQEIVSIIKNLDEEEIVLDETIHHINSKLIQFLEYIAPRIHPYTGLGIADRDYSAKANQILDLLPRRIDADQSFSYPRLFTLLLVGLPLSFFVYFIYSAAYYLQPGKEQDINKGVYCVIGAAVLVLVPALFFYKWDHGAGINSRQSRLTRARNTLAVKLNQVYVEYCQPRRGVIDFIGGEGRSKPPLCFYELAAKIVATSFMFDHDDMYFNKTVDVLEQFIRLDHRDAQEFNRLVQEHAPDNMISCIEQLVAIPLLFHSASMTTNQAFMGEGGYGFLLRAVNELRGRLGLVPWSESLSENNGMLVAMAQGAEGVNYRFAAVGSSALYAPVLHQVTQSVDLVAKSV